jgi:hypothetical protein
MRLDYAMELVTVECERLIGALAELSGGDRGLDRLNDVERACWDELRRAALRGIDVFRVTQRGVREEP